MKKTFLLTLLFLPLLSFAQLGEHFYGSFGNDVIQEIAETQDGNLLALGTKTEADSLIWLQKIRPDGSVIWERTFPPDQSANEIGFGLTIEDEGNILIVGRSQRVGDAAAGVFLKCDANGEFIWRQRYDFVSEIYDVRASGKNYFLAGSIEDLDNKNPSFVIKTDEFGSLLKLRTWGEDYRHFMKKLLPAEIPNQFYALGYASKSGGYDFWVKKLNANAEPIWEQDFATDFSRHEVRLGNIFHSQIAGCLAKGEPGFWVAAPDEDTEDIQLIRFSPEGDLVEKIVFGSPEFQEFPRTMIQLENGDFIISGIEVRPLSFFQPFSFITRITKTGREIWRKPLLNAITLLSHIQTEDKNLIFAGGIPQSNGINFNYDGYLLKTDLDGNDLPVQIKANVFLDLNENCLRDADEPGLPNWFLKTDDERLNISLSDAEGNFNIRAKEGGFSVLELGNQDKEVYEICQNRKAVLNDFNLPIQKVDFAVKLKNNNCSEPQIHLTIPDVTECNSTEFFATITNPGFQPTEPVSLTIELSKELTFKNASEPSQNIGRQIIFNIGSIGFLNSKIIKIEAEAACDLQLGAALPITARLEKPTCTEPFDGAFYAVSGKCRNNEIFFDFENLGIETGEKTSYQISANNLPATDTIEIEIPKNGNSIRLPADGRTWRVDLMQNPNYASISQPSATVEGCGTKPNGLFSTHFFNVKKEVRPSNMDEIAPKVSSGIPINIFRKTDGLGINSLMEKTDELEYSGQLSNPLSENVERVEFRLAFPSNFDPTTFRAVAFSHPIQIKSKIKDEQEIAIFMENLDIASGEKIMLRFSISPVNAPDISNNFRVSARAVLNDSEQITLLPVENSFSENHIDLLRNILEYPEGMETYGGWGLEQVHDLKMLPDGSILASGITNSYNGFVNTEALLLKINPFGKVDFLRTYDFSEAFGRNYGIKIAPLNDGSIMVTGSFSIGSESHNFLARLNPDGKIIWKKDLLAAFGIERFDQEALHATEEGDVILSGSTSKIPFYAKFDPNGTEIWRNMDINIPNEFISKRSSLMPDGSLLITGLGRTMTSYALDKIDRNGKRLDTEFLFGGFTLNPIQGMVVLKNGDVVIAATKRVMSPSSGLNIKVPIFRKKFFEGIWGTEFFPTLDTFPGAEFKEMVLAPDGGFYAVGTVNGDVAEQSTDFFIVKFSEDFEVLWSKKYGNNSTESIEKIVISPAGELLLWGTSRGTTDIRKASGIFFKTDLEGNLIPPPPVENPTVEATDILVFPNPGTDKINVLFSPAPSQTVNWIFYNLNGQRLMEGSSDSGIFSINTSRFPNGMYFLAFPNSEYSARKVLIEK